MAEHARDNGWAVASADFHGSQWGNRVAVKDTARLVLWATQTTGITPTLWIAGSMGAATSLNTLLHSEVPKPRCWYGTQPVVDLATVGNVAGSSVEIGRAYTGEVPPKWNPALNIAALPPITYRVLASPQDTRVPAALNGDRLTALPATTYQAVSGEHGDPSHFNSTDLLTFAQGC